MRTIRIGLLPERHLPEGKLSYFELNDNLRTGKQKELPTSAGFSYCPYEEIVLDQVEQILGPAMAKKLVDMSRDDIENLAVQILQATRRWHTSQIELKTRVGKEWEAVDDKLRKRIVDLRRDQLKRAIDAKVWKKADELSLELSNYSDDPAAKKDIYRLLLRKSMNRCAPNTTKITSLCAMLSTSLRIWRRARGTRSHEQRAVSCRTRRASLSNRPENKRSPTRTRRRSTCSAVPNPFIRNCLRSRNLCTKLRDRVLYVGRSRLPERMSPATGAVIRSAAPSTCSSKAFCNRFPMPRPAVGTGRCWRKHCRDWRPWAAISQFGKMRVGPARAARPLMLAMSLARWKCYRKRPSFPVPKGSICLTPNAFASTIRSTFDLVFDRACSNR